MRLLAGGASVPGPAHIQDGTPNQDAFCVNGCKGGWIIAVADGLGSRPLSHLGSRRATQLFRHLVREQGDILHDGIGQALRAEWLECFGTSFSRFETTCLWAKVDTAGRGLAGQVGDGLMLVRSHGEFLVITGHRQGFGNQTQTLAQAQAETVVSIEFELTCPGDGVLLMTDGISDDLVPEQLESFFQAIYQRQRRSSKRQMRQWLTRELNGWSTPLHGDDKTMAGIFRRD